MEWNEKLQLIIDYVEAHLQRTEQPIVHEEIAKIAGCSFSFFQKVFSYMYGISFAEYVRSRKMTLAGYDLKSTNMRVIEISYKYGYDSPTSFTKAFQTFHGVTPKEARKQDTLLRVTPKMQITKKSKYSWKIEAKEKFRLIGKQITISCQNHSHFQKIPEFWSECQRNGTFARLISMDTGYPKGLFGLFGAYDEEHQQLAYSVMVISDQQPPQGFTEIEIPGVTWAVFDCKGPVPQAIQRGWQYLNEEWLTKYPFQHADCPEIEWYSTGNVYDEHYLSQIWIPIIEED